jgi:hypothetical protein
MPRPSSTAATRTYLVEHYWPGATPAAYEDAIARVASSVLVMAARGAQIWFLHSTFVPGDEAALAVLVAESEGLVHEAYRAAGVSCDRVIEAVDSEVAFREPIADRQQTRRRSR